MKLWKYSGTLLAATGIIHTVTGLLLGKDTYVDMLRDGLVDSIKNDFARGFFFWFLFCGALLILFGQTLQHYIKKEQKPAPLFVGYALLVLAGIGCVIKPLSGFWLILPQALIIIIAHRRK